MQPVLALLALHKHKENDMGQFKPMVKMETTEPSVILKLKKGGSVAKKADGGMMGSPMSAAGAMPPSMPARGGMPGAMSPMKPSMAMRRRAMKGLPSGAGPAGPVGGAAAMQASMPPPAPMAPAMKKGGKADMSQDKAMVKKAFKQHDMQEHKGGKGTSLKLKHGGKMATGGVVDGQGGYKAGGIINTENQGGEYRNTKMHTTKANNSPAKTGGVKEGNGGGYATGGVAKANGGGYKKGGKIKGMMDGGMAGNGMMDDGMMNQGMPAYSAYKKGGAPKKAYAAGVTVNSGHPVAMPQGAKKPSQPVSTNRQAGTFKKGGNVTKFKDGGDMSKGAYDATLDEPPMGSGFAKKAHGFMDKLFGAKKEAGAGRGFVNPKSVTKLKESVTVSPMKKGGGAC
jgi:hypothetical protein